MAFFEDTTKEDLELFLQETEEQLQLLDDDILKLERENVTRELLEGIFRSAHTIKGSSAMLGYQEMSVIAHAMENVLDKLRKNTLQVDSSLIDALLHGLDILKVLKENLESSEKKTVHIQSTIDELNSISEQVNPCKDMALPQSEEAVLSLSEKEISRLKAAIDNGIILYKISITLNDQSQWLAVRCFQVLHELTAIGEIFASWPSQKEIEEETVRSNLIILLGSNADKTVVQSKLDPLDDIQSINISNYEAQTNNEYRESGKTTVNNQDEIRDTPKLSKTIRVDVNRLDTLMEQIGELVVNRNRMVQISKLLEERYQRDDLIHDLGKTSSQVAKIVSGLQHEIMTTRMLPVEVIFNSFPRMVRDLSKKANKKIKLLIEGQDTEVDRSVIEHIRDPLVHLLRNAVDHGIEQYDQRRTAGKPEQATIKLSALHEENQICITVEDDGKGLDPEAITESAIKKAIITHESAKSLTDHEAYELIFASGLSTAKKTTDISGRGVGMDIVKTNINSLNGSIAIDSKRGHGTRFTIKLPLTLSVVPALLVSANATLFAIPMSYITETVQLKPGMIKTVQGKAVTSLRDNILPIISLAQIFGWERHESNCNQIMNVVVVKNDLTNVGLIVDSLIEEQEIVTKSLGSFIGNMKGFTGATVLGDGNVALILDVTGLLHMLSIEGKKYKDKGEISSHALLTSMKVPAVTN